EARAHAVRRQPERRRADLLGVVRGDPAPRTAPAESVLPGAALPLRARGLARGGRRRHHERVRRSGAARGRGRGAPERRDRAAGEPIPLTYNLGYNLYVGDNPDADGAYVDITAGSLPVPLPGTSPTTGGALDGRAFILASEGRRLSPAESSAYWAGKAAAFV